MAINADELLVMRSAINEFLPELPYVTRDGSPVTLTMPDGSPIRCKVNTDKGIRDTREEGTIRLTYLRRWRLKFPDSTDIRPGDQINVFGTLYGVIEIINPTSWSLSTEAVAYQIYDVNGTPVYIKPNCVVSSMRNGVQILDHEAAYLSRVPPTKVGEIKYEGLLLPNRDLKAGDIIYLQEWGTNTVDPLSPYQVLEADPVGSFGFDMTYFTVAQWIGA